MKKWYSLKALGGNRAALFIYGDIVSEQWLDEEVSADSFRRDLSALGELSEIDLHINSPGGNVFAGTAIYSLLRQNPARIVAHVDGVAASIASVIMCAADEVLISEAGLIMIHNPWGVSLGDSAEHRKAADMQDQAKAAMIAAYQTRVAMTEDEIAAAMDAETWYTAQQAVDLGWADGIIPAQKMAASYDLSIFKHPPEGGNPKLSPGGEKPVTVTGEKTMTTDAKPVAGSGDSKQPINVTEIEAAARRKAIDAEKSRRSEIKALFMPFDVHADLRDACLDDMDCTPDDASKRLLARMAEASKPVQGPTRIEPGEDDSDKFRKAAVGAICANAGVGKWDAQNPMAGARLVDIMKASVERQGAKLGNVWDAPAIYDRVARLYAAQGITHTTDDFSTLFEEAIHKMLLEGFTVEPDTWSLFSRTASVQDFRTHNYYRMGSIANIEGYNEAGEFKYGTIADAEKHTYSATTKGKIIGVSRELIINDDLGGLADLVVKLGRSARRAVEDDVYDTLESNSGNGPAMSDGNNLFDSSNHGNVGGTGGITPATVDGARQLLRNQTEPNGNDYLNLFPWLILSPVANRATFLQVLGSQGDPTSGNSNSRKRNYVEGLVPDERIVDSPRLGGTYWYLFCNPTVEPVIQVSFLRGRNEPVIATEEAFNSAGVKYRVMYDYGVNAIGWRGATRTAVTG